MFLSIPDFSNVTDSFVSFTQATRGVSHLFTLKIHQMVINDLWVSRRPKAITDSFNLHSNIT